MLCRGIFQKNITQDTALITMSHRFCCFAVVTLFPMFWFSSGMAQTPSAKASLSVQGRLTVYKNVVALRGKSFNESRIIVIATERPLTAVQFEQVLNANAEETMTLESSPSYIKASFKEDGSLRYLVGDGGGAVFSKKAESSQAALQGKAMITGDRVQGEVLLSEPGDYPKELVLTFDLPIVTTVPEAQAAPE
jgi:hypothetical protein